MFVACGIHHAMRMSHIVIWPAPLYSMFPHCLINDMIFEKTLPNIKCVFWFTLKLLSETFLILRRNERKKVAESKMCVLIFSTTFSKIFTSYTTINIKIHTIKCYKFLKDTCFDRPCDHHQANFNRSCAFIVLTICDPIMCTLFFIYGLKSLKILHC